MKKKIILNHKSYLNYDEITKYKSELENLSVNNIEIILFPSVQYLSMFKDFKYSIGTQNFYSYNYGNYTGEVNLESLKQMGINYAFVGHNERKKYIFESNSLTREKLFKSLTSNFKTILFLGEPKKCKIPFKAIKKYLDYYLKNIESDKISNLSIMYEPNSFIEEDSCQDINIIRKTVISIKEYFIKKYNAEVEVYYAQGVDENNITAILEVCDGVGIGKKSINIKFVKRLFDKIN